MKYGIISDIHSDIDSLRSVYSKLDKEVEQIYNCGDIVGYGDYPNEVIDLLLDKNVISVSGNHEKALFSNLEYLFMSKKAQIAIDKNFNQLTEENLNYLENLPSCITHDNIRIVHGTPPLSHTTYLDALDKDDIKSIFSKYSQKIAFCGHTHKMEIVELNELGRIIRHNINFNKPYTLNENSRYIINVGSVSLQRDKDNTQPQFAIYDNDKYIISFNLVV
jgi:predicted phosphodiesterase